MPGARLIIGPPGTGKTTRALTLLRELLAAGVAAGAIAFVTFTRAAKKEVVDRVGREFNLRPGAFPWFRTIHSTAYRLLQGGIGRRRVMDEEAWQSFGDRTGYDLTPQGRQDPDGSPTEVPLRTYDDKVRFVHEWGRNRRLSLDQTLAQTTVTEVRPDDLRRYVSRLEAFKADNGLLDFCDLLEQVLAKGLRPPVTAAFVDEAQDLSPLQVACVEMWFEACDPWYALGDEDQTIYDFGGADPEWLLRLAQESEPEVLSRSYRVPCAVHDLAYRIIAQNQRRVPKIYAPTDEPGEVLRLPRSEALERVTGAVSTFILARNRHFLAPYGTALVARGIPFVVEGDGAPCPLNSATAVRAVRVAQAIYEGETRFPVADIKALLRYVPSRGSKLLQAGMKARLAEMTGAVDVLTVGLDALVGTIRHDGPCSVMTTLTPHYRAYFEALLRSYGTIPEPKVVLTSIHGAKGREADLVVVVPDMTRATHVPYVAGGPHASEAENRVFYTAVTRARRTLILVAPTKRRAYAFPTARYVEGVA